MSKALVVITDFSKAALCTISAAQKISTDIHMLLIGGSTAMPQIKGVTKFMHAELNNPLAEDIAEIITANATDYTHILTPANSAGKDFSPRVAAMLDVQQISEITEVINADTFKRPIYAGNIIETIHSMDAIKVITVRSIAFEPATYSAESAEIVKVMVPAKSPLSEFISSEQVKSDRPELSAAKIIISGGRGLATKENFSRLELLADKLGAAVGASRAAVDMGLCANDLQVGQTGKAVAPELYIAFGISGAIQHLAGMKDSKIIVAVNKDENAPIFNIATYGLVQDLNSAIDEFNSEITKRGK